MNTFDYLDPALIGEMVLQLISDGVRKGGVQLPRLYRRGLYTRYLIDYATKLV